MGILKTTVLTIAVSLIGFLSLGLPAVVSADSASKTAACEGLTQVDSTQDCTNQGAGVDNLVSTVVKLISYVAGIAAVIMVIVAGFKYITSGGDSSRVSSAKNTLIYALIGVAVAVLAQVLVHFAINTSLDATTLCKDGIQGHEHLTASDPHCK